MNDINSGLPFEFKGESIFIDIHPGYFEFIETKLLKDTRNTAHVLDKIEWELDKDDYISVIAFFHNKSIPSCRFIDQFHVHFCVIDDKKTFIKPMKTHTIAQITDEHRSLYTPQEIEDQVPRDLAGVIGPVATHQLRFNLSVLQDTYNKVVKEDSELKVKEIVRGLLLTEYLLHKTETQSET